MSEVASVQWIEQRCRQVAEIEAPPELSLTIEHRISGSDQRTWHVVIERGNVSVAPGPHPDATLTLTGSRSTTDAISRGEKSAQRAFLDGELQVGGNVSALLDCHGLLEKVAALSAATVRRTCRGPEPPTQD
ncbi:MAG: SCP2 sterol-binding domain-containing protein [Acidimicrobiaceae bacterium]|nr:SCP2 sterol-binding domain-containing protein [Acidimicrobiia bacterium]MCY4492867.1 SCP2 sterol-binding domain-containing protein [Acidimicrobiaceae bacterium]